MRSGMMRKLNQGREKINAPLKNLCVWPERICLRNHLNGMTQMIALAFAKVYLNNRVKDLKLIFFEKKLEQERFILMSNTKYEEGNSKLFIISECFPENNWRNKQIVCPACSRGNRGIMSNYLSPQHLWWTLLLTFPMWGWVTMMQSSDFVNCACTSLMLSYEAPCSIMRNVFN